MTDALLEDGRRAVALYRGAEHERDIGRARRFLPSRGDDLDAEQGNPAGQQGDGPGQ